MHFRTQPAHRGHRPVMAIRSMGLVFALLSAFSGWAQWQMPCEDMNRKDPYFQCYVREFAPVCGCNLKTYRNDCVAWNVFGINYNLAGGVCKNDVFEFDFFPNPAAEQINFGLEFFDKGSFSLQIFDSYGKLMYIMNKTGIHRFDDIIVTGTFKPGLYLITVSSGNVYKVKKLIVP